LVASALVAWSLFGATYTTFACHPAGAPIDPKVALAAGRAWVTEPVLMFPWTCGVAALVLFLIGALAARRTPIARSLTRIGILLLGTIVLGVVLGLRQAPCR